MTAPTLPTTVGPLGPGTLTIGQTGTPIDVSCLVNSMRIDAAASTGDPVYKLCGQARPASSTFAWTLTGNVDVDIADAAGLFALTWDHVGELVDYAFTPNDDLAVVFTGQVQVTPLSVGGDEYGAIMASDFTWTTTGQPVVTRNPGP